MTFTTVQLYNIISQKLDKETAESITDFIARYTKESFKDQVDKMATQDFVSAKISEAKSGIIKWTFVFVTGQTAVLAGIIYWMLHK